jgi:hypothetical protein
MDQMVEADVVIVPIDISEYFQKKNKVGSMIYRQSFGIT